LIFAHAVTAKIFRTIVAVVVAVLGTLAFDALASNADLTLTPARSSILDCRKDASIRWVASVFGALLVVVTHDGREVAGTIRIVAAILGALIFVVAVHGALAFGHGAVTAAVLRARTAKQVFKADDGALILFVGCEVARRHA
jgi:hypothetical protein